MITSTASLLDSATRAWERWNDKPFETRMALLSNWADLLEPAPQTMVHFQCRHALAHVGETRQMPGPTGETNELYCTGRGVILIGADSNASLPAVVGQIAAALVTGNSIILCLPDAFAMTGDEIARHLLTVNAGPKARLFAAVFECADADARITPKLKCVFA